MLIDRPRIPIRDVVLYGLWPGFIKVFIYRLKGYRIGRRVSIGFGSIISGDRVEVGDHTSIGFLTVIRGTEIRIGACVTIGSTTFLDTPYIEIGEGSRINEQVFVGGLQFPDSRFVLGRNCQVMQMTFINPSRSVIVGDDSGIGGHSLIFGHTSWLSQFEGYPVDFDSVEIGRSVSLAWRVFVLPGSKIGDGSVIGANSLVRGTIPPRSMAVGFPARVVSRESEFPKRMDDGQKADVFRNIVAEMIRFFEGSGLVCRGDGRVYEIRRTARGLWRRSPRAWKLGVSEDGTESPAEVDVFLSLREIPSNVRSRLEKHGVAWIEIAGKARSRFSNDLGDEVSLYLRRYGVRTLRRSPLSEAARAGPESEAARMAPSLSAVKKDDGRVS